MQLSEDKIIQKMLNIVGLAIKIHYYQMKMNLLVFPVDIT